jgi:hypothetical protein
LWEEWELELLALAANGIVVVGADIVILMVVGDDTATNQTIQ